MNPCFAVRCLWRPFRWCWNGISSSLSNPKCRLFIIVTLLMYSITFLVILPWALQDYPLTNYYWVWNDPHDMVRQAMKINGRLSAKAESKLSSLSKERTKQLYEKSYDDKLRFVIGVISVSRRAVDPETPLPKYLTQVMVGLHETLTKQKATEETALFICNTNKPPGAHKEAQVLSEYFPMVDKRASSTGNKYEQEKLDYAFCLEEAQKFSSEYVILIQDDALPHPDFYSILNYVVKNKLETQIVHGDPIRRKDDWLWLKLNFPNSLTYYDRNYYFAMEWVSIGLVISGAVTLPFSIIYSSISSNFASRHQSLPALLSRSPLIFMVFLHTFVYSMLLVWTVGRPWINQLRTLSLSFYSLEPGTSCCLPAVLYPHIQIPGILDYLHGRRLNLYVPLDFALDEYRSKTNLQQYLLNPNIFFHIGMFSSLHTYPSARTCEGYLFNIYHLSRQFPDLYC